MFFIPPTNIDAAPDFEAMALINVVEPAAENQFGVCQIAKAGNGSPKGATELSPSTLLWRLLPNEFQSKLDKDELTHEQTDRLVQWQDGFVVNIVGAPAHGKMMNYHGKSVPDARYYLPSDGFIGEDRIGYLLEGKDHLGNLISLSVTFFIKVVPVEEFDRKSSSPQYKKWIKSYCPKWYWPMPNKKSAVNIPDGTAQATAGLYFSPSENSNAFFNFNNNNNYSRHQPTGLLHKQKHHRPNRLAIR